MTKKRDKSPEFLSQIPEWESNYKNSDEQQIGFEREQWQGAEARFSPGRLVILECAVMEDWETPYMAELARIATSRGGDPGSGIWAGDFRGVYPESAPSLSHYHRGQRPGGGTRSVIWA